MTIPAKRCPKCGETKPLEDFYRNRSRKDGYQGRCKRCWPTSREMLERNPDNRRRIARDSYHRRKLAKPARAWPAKPYDAKTKARRKLQAEVRAGRIVRQPCEACGKPAAHAHHDDYSKPLEVRWLCPLCHAAAHRLD